jgi:hypothetical protein
MLDVGGGAGIVASTQMFARAAAAGSFAVNRTGGSALLAAIEEMRNWIDSEEPFLALLRQQPPLGSSNGAEAIKPHTVNVASDDQGFLTMLREFRTSLDDAYRGIEAAMDAYQETDTGIGDGFVQV